MWQLQPLAEKCHPVFPSNPPPHYKVEVLSSPPPFWKEQWVGGPYDLNHLDVLTNMQWSHILHQSVLFNSIFEIPAPAANWIGTGVPGFCIPSTEIVVNILLKFSFPTATQWHDSSESDSSLLESWPNDILAFSAQHILAKWLSFQHEEQNTCFLTYNCLTHNRNNALMETMILTFDSPFSIVSLLHQLSY